MTKKLITGMYGKFTPPKQHQYPADQIKRETERHLSIVFGWTCICLLAATGVVLWLSTTDVNNVIYGGPLPILMVIASALICAVSAKYLNDSVAAGYALCCFYWCTIFFSVALIFRGYANISITFMPLTASTFFGLFYLHQKMRREITPWSLDTLFIIALSLTASSALCFYVDGYWIDYLFVLLGSIGSVFVVFRNVKYLQKTNKIGNEHTKEDADEKIIGVLMLYLEFMLLALQIVRYLPAKRSKGSSKKGGFSGGSFGGGGAKGKW